MAKQTKNVITREECKNDVLNSVKKDLYHYLILLAFVTIIWFPAYAVISLAFKSHWALGIVTILPCLCAHIYFICVVIGKINLIRIVKNGGIDIAIDKAVRLTSEPVRIAGFRYKVICGVVYFRDNDRFVNHDSLFDLFNEGDEFYVVFIKTKKPKLVRAYNTRFYELKN